MGRMASICDQGEKRSKDDVRRRVGGKRRASAPESSRQAGSRGRGLGGPSIDSCRRQRKQTVSKDALAADGHVARQ